MSKYQNQQKLVDGVTSIGKGFICICVFVQFLDKTHIYERFYHIGGLQRSGTTLLAQALGSQPSSYRMKSSAAILNKHKPWKAHNMDESYFARVEETAGIEGKHVQDVYPYLYILKYFGSINRSQIMPVSGESGE